MASSSSDKVTSPSGFDSDSPDWKKIGRDSEMCSGCSKSRGNQDSASFKLKHCSACRFVFYCSSECQVSHWKAEHKQVCKKRAKDLADAREVGTDPNFVPEFDQWLRSSEMLLDCLMITMMQDAVKLASRPGAPVAPEDIAQEFCVIANADYSPGTRLPFRVRDDYKLIRFVGNEGTASPGLQEALNEFKDAAEGENMASTGFLCLRMLLSAGGVTRVLKSNLPQEGVKEIFDLPTGWTAAEIVRDLNKGSGGTGTTKSSRRIPG